jgi:fructose-bisphosphate aldolase class II
MKGEPVLDFERLQQINEALNIPLVIHGGTGLSDEQFKRLIENGVAKINYYTALADAAGKKMRDNTAADQRCGYTGIVNGIQDAMRVEIERCMMNWGSAGQADAVLAEAEAWQPVHHVIIYNLDVDDANQVSNMMREGEKVLSRIPGVRRVITASAVQQDASYKFSWLIEFVHTNVIESYRNHPDHVAFADNLFRPIAGDRISIDFSENNFPG